MLKELRAGGRTPVIPQTIGDRMREARKGVGAKQTDIADALEISRATVLDWEGNKRKPSKIAIVAWAMVTGTSSEWIETGQGSPQEVKRESPVRYNRRATDPHYQAPLTAKYPAFAQSAAA